MPGIDFGSPSTTASGGDPLYRPGDISGWSDPSGGGGGGGGGGRLQLINALGYDPSVGNRGFGSGEPTRRGIDIGLNVLGNATGIPGVGFLAGKIGRGLWHLIQNMQLRGASNDEIRAAVQQRQGGGGGGGGTSGGGFNFNWPKGLGGFGKPMGYFPPTGGFGSGDPGNYNPTGPMGGVGTGGIVNASSPAGGGSFFGGRANWGMNLPGSTFNLGASGGQLGDFGAKLALHSGRFRDALANADYINPNFMQQFMGRGGLGSGQGIGGAGRPFTQSR